MRDINYGLKRLVRNSKDGSYSTQAARHDILQQAANTLHELGYRKLRPESLKPKHVEALVAHWKSQQLSPGTIKNRLSHLRWWAGAVGKPAIIARSNGHYQVERRVYVSGEDKARNIDEEKLANVTDHHTRMSLRMQQAFGLRREEAIKFNAFYADRGDKIVLKGSWTKGGKAREIPVRNEAQRHLLDDVRCFAGRGALIPCHKNYVQQMRTYERNTAKAGLDRNHGLRHAYAQERYKELTGWQCPAVGGPERKSLTTKQREADRAARDNISRELGHARIAIVAVYCG
ncbi:MAG: site-specific recombinase XerD [Halieaceae bacterium]|jgi:site-specific recombinase XerD